MELSPTESLLSVPGDDYSSLFPASSTGAESPSTMNPLEMMTPRSSSDDKDEADGAESPSQDGDKKPTKKRKSWGQVLPEPKTNLPPRKRAKTDDEKEQRRVERVLRNRRAAQSSRERKRLEVEALERRNQELESLLLNAQKANLLLVDELNRFRRDSGVVTRTSSPLDALRDNNMTLAPELFKGTVAQANSLVDINATTVNPASISPELAPVSDAALQAQQTEASAKASTTPDVTQHPAAMLSDLPCHMSASVPLTSLDSTTTPRLAWFLQLRMLLLSASAILTACERPLTQIAMSSKAGFSLLPTPQLLTTIIWLVTLPPASRISPISSSSTLTTSSTTRPAMSPLTLWQRATMPLRTTVSTSRSTTLRVKSIRKILTSSPSLARPLMDATLVALRLVSEGCDNQVVGLESESSATRAQESELTECLRGIKLPSREVLLTLLWTLKVESAKLKRREESTNTVYDPNSEATVMAQKQRRRFQNISAGRRRPRLH